jgi:hypothetical protein
MPLYFNKSSRTMVGDWGAAMTIETSWVVRVALMMLGGFNEGMGLSCR